MPLTGSIAVLVNPTRLGVDAQVAQIQEAARAIELPLHIVKAASQHDLDAEFSSLAQLKVGGLVITADALFTDQQHRIVALAKRYAVPTFGISWWPADSSATAPIPMPPTAKPETLSVGFSRARSPPIFPSCDRAFRAGH